MTPAVARAARFMKRRLSGLQGSLKKLSEIEFRTPLEKGVNAPADKIDLYLNLSTLCNYNCIFCDRGRKPEVLRLRDFPNLDSYLAKARKVNITCYGETMLHPDFHDMLRLMFQWRLPVDFTTNASRVPAGTIELLTSKESTFASLVVSVNSLDPETYKKIHRSNSDLAPVLRNVEKFAGARKTKIFEMILSFVITAYNLKEMKAFIEMGRKHNCTVYCPGLVPLLRHRYTDDMIVEDSPANRAYFDEMRAYAAECGVPFSLYDIDSLETKFNSIDEDKLKEMITGCPFIYNAMYISPDGLVAPCCWTDHKIGSVMGKSFAQIWLGKGYRNFRRLVKKGSLKHCSNCRRLG